MLWLTVSCGLLSVFGVADALLTWSILRKVNSMSQALDNLKVAIDARLAADAKRDDALTAATAELEAIKASTVTDEELNELAAKIAPAPDAPAPPAPVAPADPAVPTPAV